MRSTTLDFSQLGEAEPWSDTTWNKGDIVYRFGVVFAATKDGVQSDPIDPQNKDDWFAVPTIQELVRKANNAEPLDRSLHPVHDINNGGYTNHLRINRIKTVDKTYDFYFVHEDGTQITDDSDLEAIFDPDGSDEYPFLSLIAEEDAGTWTLKNHAGTFAGAQTSGGERDTLGEVGADQMQRITGAMEQKYASIRVASGAFSVGGDSVTQNRSSSGDNDVGDLTFDSANSPDARASSSTDGETRPAYATTGIPAVIVMREATS